METGQGVGIANMDLGTRPTVWPWMSNLPLSAKQIGFSSKAGLTLYLSGLLWGILHYRIKWWLLFSYWVVSDSFVTPYTIAPQAPLSVGFSRQEYWSGLPFPSPGDLPDPGIEPVSCIAGGFFTAEPPGRPPEYSWLLDKYDSYMWKWLFNLLVTLHHTQTNLIWTALLILFFKVLFDSFYKASITLITKLEKFITEKARPNSLWIQM